MEGTPSPNPRPVQGRHLTSVATAGEGCFRADKRGTAPAPWSTWRRLSAGPATRERSGAHFGRRQESWFHSERVV